MAQLNAAEEDAKSSLVVDDKRSKINVYIGDRKDSIIEDRVEINGHVAESATEWERVPPDGGWGWLVLFGSLMVNVLVPGTVKSFGVLFVEFMEVFQASPAAAAWIPALCYFLYSSLGPVSSLLSVKYSYRTVTLLGGTLAALGMILSFWASSVDYLYVSYGILVGAGAGLAFPPTVYIVTSYFVRLRGLANGLCISGSALGSIILPPLLRFFLETYGYRGAVLIMGGITLNVWVGAIFYHPVEQHLKKVPKELSSGNEEAEADEEKAVEMPFLGQPQQQQQDTEPFARSASSAAVQYYNKHASEKERKISVPARRSSVTRSQMRSTPALHGPTGHNRSMDMFSQGRLPASRRHASVRAPRRSPSTSSFQYVSTPYHGSTLSALHPQEFASSLSLAFQRRSSAQAQQSVKDSPKNKYFDISLLRDPLYLVILISNSTNAISYTNFIILLPAYAIQLGFDKSSAAYLLSIVSALDLVGRIGGSALSDVELIPKKYYFIGGLLVSGVALAILPFAETYKTVSIYCGIFGLASGVYVGITAVIMADMLGTERLTSSYGISLFVNGVLQLVGPPLCGVWFEETGSYFSLFSTFGIVLMAGASLWCIVPFLKRNKT